MLREIDLPCSDCGAALVERRVDAGEPSVSTSIDGTVTLAECPRCGARYFPERSLPPLQPGSNLDASHGGW